MARRACLAIGIGDAPPLTYLGGAVRAAEALGAWAKKAGYDTLVLTDETQPVRLNDVEAALARLLPDEEATDRLIISFAGHGVLNGLEDLWLLSQWLRENEAISLSALRRFLARYNLRQLVIVSDACRKASTSAQTGQLTPHPGVRRGNLVDHRLQTDLFRATSSYAAAFMLRGRSQEEDRCLFSSLLVEALSGGAADAFMHRDGRTCLFSDSLATWLEAAVPARAKQYGLDLEPEIEAGLRFPDDLYVEELPAKRPKPAAWPDPAEISSISLDSHLSDRGLRPPPGCSWSTRDDLPPLPDGVQGRAIKSARRARSAGDGLQADLDFGADVDAEWNPLPQTPAGLERASLMALIERDRLTAARRRADAGQVAEAVRRDIAAQDRPTHFETGAGFAVAGLPARSAWLGPDAHAEDDRHRAWWRIVPTRPDRPAWSGGRLAAPLPLLVELEDGRWAGAAAMPNFVATFGLDAAGVSSLVCRHMVEPDAGSSEQAIAFRAAGTLTAAQLSELIIKFRARKHRDPVLGVLAAYLHDRAGDLDNVIRTAYYFVQFGQPIPFDIALLARLPARRRPDGQIEVTVPAVEAAPASRKGKAALPNYLRAATPAVTGLVAGAFPWLREGWSLLDGADDSGLYPPELPALARALTPALFTTLSAEGGRALVGALERWGVAA